MIMARADVIRLTGKRAPTWHLGRLIIDPRPVAQGRVGDGTFFQRDDLRCRWRPSASDGTASRFASEIRKRAIRYFLSNNAGEQTNSGRGKFDSTSDRDFHQSIYGKPTAHLTQTAVSRIQFCSVGSEVAAYLTDAKPERGRPLGRVQLRHCKYE